MYFKKIKIDCFGIFHNWEAIDLSRGLNVILGLNEGGKSTLFYFLSTLMYGFSPANLDQHPYVPWDGSGRPGGEGELVLDVGSSLQVFRRLLSSPQGRLVQGDKKENLHNRALPWLSGVSREIYHEVYALTLAKMKFFEDASWEEVQDRLLGNMGATFLNPASQVITALEEEAKSLWREDRRGRPKYRELNSNLSAWRRDMEKIWAEEEKRKEKDRRLQEVQFTMQKLKNKKLDLKTKLHKAQRLNPLRKKLAQLEELAHMANRVQVPPGFPSAPLSKQQHLEEKISDKEKQAADIKQRINKAREKINNYSRKEESIVAREKEIQSLEDEKAVELARRDNIEKLEKELSKEEKRGEMLGENILESSFTEVERKLINLPGTELKERLDNWLKEKDDYLKVHERLKTWPRHLLPGGKINKKSSFPLAAVIAITISIFSLAGAILADWLLFIPAVLAAALAAAFLIFSFLWNQREENARQMAEQEEKRLQEELHKLRKELSQKKLHFLQALQGLPLAPARVQEPSELLLNELFSLQELARRLVELREELKQLQEESRQWGEKVKQLARQLGLNTDLSSPDLMFSLKKALEEALEKRKVYQQGQEDMAELEEQQKIVEGEKKRLEKDLFFLKNTFSAWGEGDEEKGKELFVNQEKAKQNAEELQKQLDMEFPDKDVLIKEIEEAEASQDSWLFSDKELVKTEAELQEVDEQLEKLRSEEASLRKELELAAGNISPAELAGKKERLQEEMKETVQKRDRLALLASIIREAEGRFRKEHQPHVLRRAGNYLNYISRGRYTALYLEEENRQLVVQEGGNPYPLPVQHPVSRGTLDQIFLALRLALVDHLDHHQETLPLFLDEILVNWDEKRLLKGVDLLREIAGRRQVFFFTCHFDLARQMARQTGARFLTLD